MSKKNKKTELSKAADAVKETAENAADATKETAEAAADTAKETAEAAADTAKETAEAAADAAKETAEAAADAAKETAEAAADAAKETAENAADAAKAEGENYKGILGDYKEQPEGAEEGIGDGPKQEEPKEKKPANKKALVGVGIAASVVLVGCLSVVGIRAMQANKPIPVVTSEHYTVDKDVFACFYQQTINTIRDYYGEDMLLSYYQLDLSKSLKDQPYPVDDGTTWFDNFVDEAVNTVQQQLMFAEAGIEAGFELPDDKLREIDEKLAEVDLSTYGEGITKSDLRQQMMISAYSEAYFDYYIKSLNFEDDEIQAYFDANTDNYVTCGLLGFTINFTEETDSESASDTSDAASEASSEETSAADAASESAVDESTADEASSEESTSADEELDTAIAEEPESMDKATAQKLANELKACKDPAAFEKKVREILKDYEHANDDEIELRIDAIRNDKYGYTPGADLSEWAFKGGAKVNDTKVLDSEGAFYVYMLTSEPSRDESSVIDVRHILFAVSEHSTSEDPDTVDTAALEECRALANDCMAAWEASDKTEDSFAALATERTEDPGSKETGGLYENVYVGQMVPEFNDWCFDPSRQPGDYGIVETDYGVHLMYFVKNNGPKWKADIKNALLQQSYQDWVAELQEKYTMTVDTEAAKSIDG